jgi:hypothetical protein
MRGPGRWFGCRTRPEHRRHDDDAGDGDDTATGDRIGGVTGLIGGLWTAPVLFGADGAHAIITTNTYDSRTSTSTMLYSTIDTDTGSKTGTRLDLPTSDVNSNTYTTHVGVVDTTTGDQIGGILAFSAIGGQYSQLLSDDGSHMLMLAGGGEPPQPYTTRASVVSTITGTQVGATLTFAGAGTDAVLSEDGAHALIVTFTPHWLSLSSTTRVSILRIA